MKRSILWRSGQLDEIELVYEKAEADEAIGKMIQELEDLALEEARNHHGLIRVDGESITLEQYEALEEEHKEALICVLGDSGLSEMKSDMGTGKITAKLSSSIQNVLGCTMFNIINRIEKLDGAFNVLVPDDAVLELQVPAGAKKGLVRWEMLIMQLYPWLSVSEVTSDEVADGLIDRHEPAQNGKQMDPDVVRFLNEMVPQEGFYHVYRNAINEMAVVIQTGIFELTYKGQPLTHEIWMSLGEVEQVEFALAMGNHAVTIDTIVCVDYIELFPSTIAVSLLYAAWSGKVEKQLIDAGEGTELSIFVNALNRLYPCCSRWECTIGYPKKVVIGQQQKPEKKSLFKRFLGK